MINFPRMHIADSVTNRILNLRDELAPMRAPAAAPQAAPGAQQALPGAGPGLGLGSMLLDQRLAQPAPPMALPDDPAMSGLAAMLAGGGV